MSDSGYWQFCEIIERTNVPGPMITTPAETEQAVLEQHTESGEYRIRSLSTVMQEVADG